MKTATVSICFILQTVVTLLSPVDLFAQGVEATLTQIGDPTWKPVDVSLFSGPTDTFEAFKATETAVLGSPLETGIRSPPYDTLISDGLVATGLQSTTTFVESDIDGTPLGLFFIYVAVPDPGTTGTSLDFESGPIIPNSLFPFSHDGDLLREGVVIDPDFDGPIPPLAGFDGRSHAPSVMATNGDFFPPGTELVGSYEFRSTLLDAAGNGWGVVAPFQVVPEPNGLAIALVSVAAAYLGMRRRLAVPT